MIDEREVEELVRRAKPYQPARLYKYRSMDGPALDRVFSVRKVYFPDATQFNDPFETKPLLRMPKNRAVINRLVADMARRQFPDADRRTRRKLAQPKRREVKDTSFWRGACDDLVRTTGVFCLTEINNDILMWSHYSRSHEGLCLEFDSSDDRSLFGEAGKVTYQDEYPTVNLLRFGGDALRNLHLTKSTHWKHEQEWRVLRFDTEGGPREYDFPPALLTGVILGARMSTADEHQVRSWIESFPTEVKLYRAQLNDSRYQIGIIPADGV